MIKSIAVYDILYIGNALEEKLDDFSEYELQLFSYLACLLSLYDSNPVASWGYNFIKNNLGSPFSKEINDALKVLISRGSLLETSAGFYRVSESGQFEFDTFSKMHTNRYRKPYLDAACKSIKLLPYGLIKDSISHEPILWSANQHSNKRLLTDDDSAGFSVLYEQFDMLRTALVQTQKNLLMPALVWIEYLSYKHRKDFNSI